MQGSLMNSDIEDIITSCEIVKRYIKTRTDNICHLGETIIIKYPRCCIMEYDPECEITSSDGPVIRCKNPILHGYDTCLKHSPIAKISPAHFNLYKYCKHYDITRYGKQKSIRYSPNQQNQFNDFVHVKFPVCRGYTIKYDQKKKIFYMAKCCNPMYNYKDKYCSTHIINQNSILKCKICLVTDMHIHCQKCSSIVIYNKIYHYCMCLKCDYLDARDYIIGRKYLNNKCI